MHAWQEATGESFFVWGRNSGSVDNLWFATVKHAYRAWLDKTSHAKMTIYHDGLGADALGPLDPSENKVLMLHNWFPRWEKNFDWMLRCTGKVAVGDPSLMNALRGKFAWIPERYIHALPGPRLQGEPGEGGTGAKQRTGIWLHGCRWRRFGNRLRSIVDRWPPEVGELEIIASGRRPAWSNKPFVKWSADLPMQFALMRIHTWDSCLLLNDFAFDQPWLLLALERGCFPLIPEGSGITSANIWREESAPQRYEWGDMDSATGLLRQWREQKSELEKPFKSWIQQVLDKHDTGKFADTWDSVKTGFLQSRSPKLRLRKPVGNLVPVAWYERVQRLRSGA